MSTSRLFGPLLLVSAVLAIPGFAQTPAPTYTPGQEVQIREGDEWTLGKVIRREGRKVLVKYDDGTEEWVTPDRLKPVDAEGTTDAGKPDAGKPGTAAPGSTAKPAVKPKPKPVAYTVGQRIEMKSGTTWESVKVVRRQGDWYLVEQSEWPNRKYWAEPWLLRLKGSSYDLGDTVWPHHQFRNDGPPTAAPGPKPGETEAGRPARSDPFSPPPIEQETTEIKGEPKLILTVAPDGGWKVPLAGPDPGQKPIGQPLVLPPDGASRLDTLRFNGTTGLLSASRFGTGGETDCVRIDLVKSTATAIDMPDASEPLALSPAGGFIVARSAGFHSGTFARLDVYKPGASSAEHVISFLPFGPKKDVSTAFFADENTILVIGDGAMVAYDFAKAMPKWKLILHGDTWQPAAYALSPNGKQLAASTPDGIVLMDAVAGKVLGVLDSDRAGDLTYSADGAKLVGRVGAMLTVWDLATGKTDLALGLPRGVIGTVTAIDGEYILIGDCLFAVSKKQVIWRYTGGRMIAVGGRVFTVYADANRGVLTSAVLPHPRAKILAERASPASMALKPGVTVTIDVQTDSDQAAKDALIADLRKQLLNGGMAVGEGGLVKLVARTTQGPGEQREYETRPIDGPRFGPMGASGGDRETVTITRKIYDLTIEINGQPAWEFITGTSNDPGMRVRLQQGQTIQQVADAQGTGRTSDPLFGVKIPTRLAAPVDVSVIPSSTWGLAGVKDN